MCEPSHWPATRAFDDEVGRMTIENPDAAHPAPGRRVVPGGPENGVPVGVQRLDRVRPHPRRAPSVPGNRGPGVARGPGRAGRVADHLTARPPPARPTAAAVPGRRQPRGGTRRASPGDGSARTGVAPRTPPG